MKRPEDEAQYPKLRNLLHEWNVDAQLPAGFRQRVWTRIAAAEPKPFRYVWQDISGALAGLIARPRFAFAYVGVLLAIGLSFGWTHAGSVNEQIESTLSARYIQSVDPYQMPRN